jgi:hypothetical protein
MTIIFFGLFLVIFQDLKKIVTELSETWYSERKFQDYELKEKKELKEKNPS